MTTKTMDISYIKEKFEIIGCAQLQDAAPQYTTVLNGLGLVSRVPGLKVCGPVFPVVTQNDMLPCLQALDQAPEGSVIFIHNESSESEALAGDIYVTAALQQKLGGLVVNGAVRDIDTLARMGLPVYSKTVTYVSAKTAKVPAAQVPATVSIGDAVIAPGSWIFGDSDGMLLIKEEHVSVVFKAAFILQKREDELKSALARGERLGDVCGLSDFVAGRGPLRFEV